MPLNQFRFLLIFKDVDMLLDELQMIDLERKDIRLTRSMDQGVENNNNFDAKWLRDTQGKN